MAKNQIYTTPRGRAIYPHLNTPDTKFDEGGVYRVKIAVPHKLTEDLLQKIDAAAAQALTEARKDPKKKHYKEAPLKYAQNPENDEEVILDFKMHASFEKDGEKINLKPALFDAKSKPLPQGTKIGGGSSIKVAFEIVPYAMASTKQAGVTLRLKAVQVFELRSFGASADAFGFEAEEGYEAPAEETFPGGAQDEKPAREPGADTEESQDGSDF